MPIQWKAAYDAALQESDPGKVKELCERARRLILDRTLELKRESADPRPPEREELDAALRQLVGHEYARLPRQKN